MSFRLNDCEQLSIDDSFNNLTERERKALENSWAKSFAEDIFPYIDEKPYKVLYSDRPCKSNTPVNVLIGAGILKEAFGISDDELIENLMLDIRYQYALHTTSFDEQPLSDKSLSRFRKRCYDYNNTYGIDLIHGTMTQLADKISKFMNIMPDIKRMDSLMIEANIKKLSRLELLYTCIAKLCIYLRENADVGLPEKLLHYTEKNDYNKVIYHNRSEESDSKLLTLLKDADTLLDLCETKYEDVTEYQLFVRCISEQTIVTDGNRRLKTKEDGMPSDIMQNPSDPEATFREKAGKEHRGYAANITESVGENGSVVTDYQFEANTYSDSQFIKDYFAKQSDDAPSSVMIADGAYSGEDNIAAAEEKNARLITTDLTGKESDDIITDFEISENGNEVITCPAHYSPLKSRKDPKTGIIRATFNRDCCAGCPNRDKCKAKINKRVANVTVSTKAIARAEIRKYMRTDEFKNYARIRNGVETIPSILRNIYDVDKMPRGKTRGRLFLGFKIGALNFKKLLTFKRGTGNYAKNPILATVNG